MLRLREALEQDFNADEFRKLPREERVQICILMAERTQAIAMHARAIESHLLVNIATQWLHLADVIGTNSTPPRAN